MSEPLQISEEAREAEEGIHNEFWKNGEWMSAGTRVHCRQIIQLFISSSTDKLAKELGDTKAEKVQAIQDRSSALMALKTKSECCSALEKQVLELRECLTQFDTRDSRAYEAGITKALSSTTSPTVDKKWVSRDILKTLFIAAKAHMNLSCDAESREHFRKAVEAAGKELG